MFQIIYIVIIFIIITIFFIFLFDKYWNYLIKISNKRIEKRISSGKISDEKLTKLCQFYANPNVPLALITGGIFYKKVLKLQKSSYHLYRLEAKKRNLFI